MRSCWCCFNCKWLRKVFNQQIHLKLRTKPIILYISSKYSKIKLITWHFGISEYCLFYGFVNDKVLIITCRLKSTTKVKLATGWSKQLLSICIWNSNCCLNLSFAITLYLLVWLIFNCSISAKSRLLFGFFSFCQVEDLFSRLKFWKGFESKVSSGCITCVYSKVSR